MTIVTPLFQMEKIMKKTISLVLLLSLVVLVVLILAACGGSASPPFGDAVKGKVVFAGTCATCHGPDAKGLPKLGKDMTISEFIASQSNDQLLAFVQHGRPTSDPANTTGVDMPPKGGNPALTEEQLKDVIAFIRTLNTVKK